MSEKRSLADDSSDTATQPVSFEEGRENVRNSNPNGLSRVQSGVDVDQAERDFAELSREFSNISRNAKRASKHSKNTTDKDLEMSSDSTEAEEPWSLEEALHGSRKAEADAGIKPKHIGM